MSKIKEILKTHDQIIGFFSKKKYSRLTLLSALPLVVVTCLKQANMSKETFEKFIETVYGLYNDKEAAKKS